jgi:hypothetical protein
VGGWGNVLSPDWSLNSWCLLVLLMVVGSNSWCLLVSCVCAGCRFNADAAANPQDARAVHLDDNLRRANLQVGGG